METTAAPEKPRPSASDDRKTRLSAALRANLRRRKAAAAKEKDVPCPSS
ncbi:MAG: hypothetical protein SFX19_00235 [Alphaproteobacteria bacterium]|nr:hypothetical protein [Alphaproteobacteria bacterium]